MTAIKLNKGRATGPGSLLCLLCLCLGSWRCGDSAPEETAPKVASQPTAASLPNVVLITIDTLRYEHLGCYGYYRDTTPNIDALAAEGILFERALVTMSTTLPSHLSMLTGVYAFQHGRESNVMGAKRPFGASDELRSVAACFTDAGYQTASIVSSAPLGPVTGIQTGFETAIHAEGSIDAEKASDHALKWLGSIDPERPFFLWIHYWDAHEPNHPPAEYAALFVEDEKQRKWLEGRDIDIAALTKDLKPFSRKYKLFFDRGEQEKPGKHSNKSVKLSTQTFCDLMNRYDGDVRFIDHNLGRVFDSLKEKGLWDDTIVTVTADHGQELGENLFLGHGRLTNMNVFVPLIIRFPPAQRSIEQPSRDDRLVSMVDLMPTLLGRIGLPGKEDFLQQCEGEDFLSPSFERAFALTQRTSQRITDADKGKKKYAILTNRWRYEYVEGMSGRLFDLEDELTEVTSSHPKVASDLDAHLRRVLERRFSNKAKPAEPEAEKRLLEQLEELGYGGEED